MDNPVLLIFGVIAFAIIMRVIAGGMDGDRVRNYIEKRGGRLISAGWAPFGKGWFGEKSDRIYAVRYMDKDDNEHQASCKTSMFTGVYFSEDRIVHYGKQIVEESEDDARLTELELENQRLRDQLDKANQRNDLN